MSFRNFSLCFKASPKLSFISMHDLDLKVVEITFDDILDNVRFVFCHFESDHVYLLIFIL